MCVCVEKETEDKRECSLFVSCVSSVGEVDRESKREREEPKKNEFRN